MAELPYSTKDKAKALFLEGKSMAQVAQLVGVAPQTISRWAGLEKWVDSLVDISPAKNGTLEVAISALSSSSKATREADYDDKMHRIACSIPSILSQLPQSELLTKADKVLSLVRLSREILGKDKGKGNRPMISLGILTGNPSAVRIQDKGQVVEVE